MTDLKYKLNNAKDKVSSKSDLKEKGIKIKKDIVESINDIIDEKGDKK